MKNYNLEMKKKIRTEHKKITILYEKSENISWELMKQLINNLLITSDRLDKEQIQNQLKKILTTYRPRSIYDKIKSKNIENFLIKGEA